MSWFSFALALLSLVKSILELVEKRKAENAAEAAIILKMLRKADVQIAAITAASLADRERARSGRLSDDDFRD